MALRSENTAWTTLYAETRMLEKRATVARLELGELHAQALVEVARTAERKIQAVRRLEEQVKQQLDRVTRETLDSEQWTRFQAYAQDLRKQHLGEDSPKPPSRAPLTPEQHLNDIHTARLRCESLLAEFMKQINSEGSPWLPELSLNGGSAPRLSEGILEKMRTEPSFDISPIKKPQVHLPEKDNGGRPHPMDSSTLNEKLSHFKYSEVKSPLSILHTIPDVSTVSPVSLRSLPRPQPEDRAPPIQTTVRSSPPKLSMIRSEPRLRSPGHRDVLSMLHQQQMRFDKLKHGVP